MMIYGLKDGKEGAIPEREWLKDQVISDGLATSAYEMNYLMKTLGNKELAMEVFKIHYQK